VGPEAGLGVVGESPLFVGETPDAGGRPDPGTGEVAPGGGVGVALGVVDPLVSPSAPGCSPEQDKLAIAAKAMPAPKRRDLKEWRIKNSVLKVYLARKRAHIRCTTLALTAN